MGADKIEIYLYDITETILSSLFDIYKNASIVSTTKWNLPVKPSEIWYYGQLVAVHDCLYRWILLGFFFEICMFRSIGHSTWTAFHDVDEFIVPLKSLKWQELIDSLPQTAAAFCFLTYYFPLPSDYKLPITQFYFERTSGLNFRLKKCLVKPDQSKLMIS